MFEAWYALLGTNMEAPGTPTGASDRIIQKDCGRRDVDVA